MPILEQNVKLKFGGTTTFFFNKIKFPLSVNKVHQLIVLLLPDGLVSYLRPFSFELSRLALLHLLVLLLPLMVLPHSIQPPLSAESIASDEQSTPFPNVSPLTSFQRETLCTADFQTVFSFYEQLNCKRYFENLALISWNFFL